MKNRKMTKNGIEIIDVQFTEVKKKEHLKIIFHKIKLEWFCLIKWHNQTEITGNIVWQLITISIIYYMLFVVMLFIDLIAATLVVLGKYILWQFLTKTFLWQFLTIKVIWELIILNISVWTYKELFKSVFSKAMFWVIMFILIMITYTNWNFIITLFK